MADELIPQQQPQVPDPQTAPQMGLADAMQPLPPEVQAMKRPASTPEELEVRKAGWIQVISKVASDPNLMRAIGMAGSSLMQPKDWGQTNAGHMGNAYQVGQSAYDFGQQAEMDQRRAAAKEGREQEMHVVDVASKAATTEGTQARTAETKVDTGIKTRTADDVVAHAKLANENIQAQLRAAKTKNEKDQIELVYEQQRKAIWDKLPPELKTAAVKAELEKPVVANKKALAEASHANAQAGQASAMGGYYRAKAGEQSMENEAVAGLSKEEKQQYFSKTGKFATGGAGGKSAQVALAEQYGEIWSKANPPAANEKPEAYEVRKNTAKEKFMVSARGKPDIEQFLKAAGVFDFGGDIDEAYAKWSKFQASQGGAPGTPKGGGMTQWGRDAQGNPVPIKGK